MVDCCCQKVVESDTGSILEQERMRHEIMRATPSFYPQTLAENKIGTLLLSLGFVMVWSCSMLLSAVRWTHRRAPIVTGLCSGLV